MEKEEIEKHNKEVLKIAGQYLLSVFGALILILIGVVLFN